MKSPQGLLGAFPICKESGSCVWPVIDSTYCIRESRQEACRQLRACLPLDTTRVQLMDTKVEISRCKSFDPETGLFKAHLFLYKNTSDGQVYTAFFADKKT